MCDSRLKPLPSTFFSDDSPPRALTRSASFAGYAPYKMQSCQEAPAEDDEVSNTYPEAVCQEMVLWPDTDDDFEELPMEESSLPCKEDWKWLGRLKNRGAK